MITFSSLISNRISEALEFHNNKIIPSTYNQIIEECDELARDYAMGEEHIFVMNKRQRKEKESTSIIES